MFMYLQNTIFIILSWKIIAMDQTNLFCTLVKNFNKLIYQPLICIIILCVIQAISERNADLIQIRHKNNNYLPNPKSNFKHKIFLVRTIQRQSLWKSSTHTFKYHKLVRQIKQWIECNINTFDQLFMLEKRLFSERIQL